MSYLDEKPVGCGAICLQNEMPSPDNPSGRCAYFMNIYVRKEHRGNGIGNRIVNWLIDYSLRHDVRKIYLETTLIGKSLYENSGFTPMADMMIYKAKR